ncbi:MAG: ParM/StbA family protein [Oscillospiraceae bacterium]|nr:ParM/StbA family protein [Oscillospiraceae bacterium]
MSFINQTQPIVIGVDSGHGNIKTANYHFPTAVISHDAEPTFKANLLVYNDRYYTIGEGHKEFLAEKTVDQDHYVLMLAAVALELHRRSLTSARVHLAAGLPLTWVGEQKESYKTYLLQNGTVDYTYRGIAYHVEFVGADVFPQGFSAVAGNLREFRGVNMLCDIGNGTMNVMYINNCRPVSSKCFTERYGVHQCMLATREALTRRYQVDVDDSVIEQVFRFNEADIADAYLTTIRESAAEYVDGIMRRLREHGYDPRQMRLYVMGGGGCLVKNFGCFDAERVTFNDDLCATAKGYEALAVHKLHGRGGSIV